MTYPTPNWKPQIGKLACIRGPAGGRLLVTDLAHSTNTTYPLISHVHHGWVWTEKGEFEAGVADKLDLVEPTPQELAAYEMLKAKTHKKREVMVTVKFTNEELTSMMLKAAGAPEGVTAYELQNEDGEVIQFDPFQIRWWTTEDGQE